MRLVRKTAPRFQRGAREPKRPGEELEAQPKSPVGILESLEIVGKLVVEPRRGETVERELEVVFGPLHRFVRLVAWRDHSPKLLLVGVLAEALESGGRRPRFGGRFLADLLNGGEHVREIR